MAVKLGEAVNGIEGRGVVEGIIVDDGDDDGAMEWRELEGRVIEGMVVVEGDNDGGVSMGGIGGEGTMVELGEAVTGIEGKGVAEGNTVDDDDDEGAMEGREIEDDRVLKDGEDVIVGKRSG
jgi:hypothetical protein